MPPDTTESEPLPRPGPAWHGVEADSVEAMLETSLDHGLTDPEVERLRQIHGRNEVAAEKSKSMWPLLLGQFKGPLIAILAVAAAISLAIGEGLEAVAISGIVAVNGLLGFAQEWRADRAIDELQAMFVHRTRVRRNGRLVEVDAAELVPGDVLELAPGDQVPADARIVHSTALQVDESALTGESVAVWKSPDAVASDAPIAERSCLVHLGTSITQGRGTAIVTAIGLATEFGNVVDLTGSAEPEDIPLQRSLSRLGRRLGVVAVGVAAFTVGIGIAVGRPASEMFLTGVSLAVAVVPEGLPAVVTVTLAVGVRTMSQRRALLRHLEAAETLGAASVICTDKTGTLTENRMTVQRVWTFDEAIGLDSGTDEPLSATSGSALAELLRTAQTCNHAALEGEGNEPHVIGDPTEGALLVLARRFGTTNPSGEVVSEVPFDSDRKMMTVIESGRDGLIAHTKGAPEVVLDRCDKLWTADGLTPIDATARFDLDEMVSAMARDGLRTLALAQREMRTPDDVADSRLTLLGVVGMHDPPRPEVRDAVATAHRAGVTVIMMTGDSPDTGLAVARQVGLLATDSVRGVELDRLSDVEAVDHLDGSHVFARVTPAHKMRMVRLLQDDGAVVAMTGDGVNDAPALRQASVGIAMGKRGTDVAREASDVVLADDNFASIVDAIEEGRRQYSNIAKFIGYLLSANLGEAVAVSGSVALGWPLILLPAQILWMNLVTDGATALALGIERTEPDTMTLPPRPVDEPVLTRERISWIVAIGAVIGLVTMLVFRLSIGSGDGADLLRAQTLAFTAIVLLETVNVFNFRSEHVSLLTTGMFSNRWLIAAAIAAITAQVGAVHLAGLSHALGTVALKPEDWLILAVVAAPLLAFGESAKAFRRHRAHGDLGP